METVHRRLAEIGLRVAARYGFALAGGYAVQAHGILDRPSEDVDLCTAWECRGEFAAAVDTVVDAYRESGYTVEITQRFETFARLAVAEPSEPDHPYKVELAANWRASPPVMMDIGPVLHVDDVVAGKMPALYTRAEPRDFLDIDDAVTTGRYIRRRLRELAEQRVIKAVRRAKLFVFLRRPRHELFTEEFQAELAQAYTDRWSALATLSECERGLGEMSSYVFMKLLETRASRYDLGMGLLSFGRIGSVYQSVADRVPDGVEVLEVGRTDLPDHPDHHATHR